MNVKMLKLGKLSVAIALVLASCNSEKFKAGAKKEAQPQEHLVTINGVDNYDAGYKTVKAIDTIDFTIQETAYKTETGEASSLHPVDLYFVVDVTASMKQELADIRTALPTIVRNLKAKNVDLWTGFIGFIDQPSAEHTIDITSDVDQVANFIANLQDKGNRDNEEGAIMAATEAANRFANGAGRPDAAKVILLITDVVGHDGSGTDFNRNCRISPFVNAYNQLANQLQDSSRLKFFYTVPDPKNYVEKATYSAAEQDDEMAHHTCRDGETGATYKAKSQMEAIFNGITPQYPSYQKGGPLLQNGEMAWPLTSDNLTGTLVPMIATTAPTNRILSCMAKSLRVVDEGNQNLFSWEKENASQLTPTDSNSIFLNDVIKNTLSAGETMNIELQIDRCCMEVDENRSPISNQCAERYTQLVKYRVISE